MPLCLIVIFNIFSRTVDDIPVAIMLETIQEDKDWSEEEREIVYTMQEDSSVIIDGLIMFNGLALNN